jgi:FMN reductase
MIKIAIISGSPAEQSRLNGLLQEVRSTAEAQGWNVEEVQVRKIPPEDLIHCRFDSPSILENNRIVEEADAVVVATPIYKASYSGVLKTFLDLLPQKGLKQKIVLPIAIGGTIAHLLAIDYALKPVLSSLGANHILGGVYALDSQVTRLEGDGLALDDELKSRLDHSLSEWVRQVMLAATVTQA